MAGLRACSGSGAFRSVRAGEDLLDAVHRADAALYQGKQQGRNQVVLSQAPTGQDARPERARSPAMRQD